MNAPTAPKKAAGLKQLNQPLSPKATARIVGGILLALLLGGGGYWLYSRLTAGPPSPEKVRAMIRKFLRKQTGQKEFRVALPAVLTNNAAWQVPSAIPPVRTNPPPAVTTSVTNATGSVTNTATGTNRLISRVMRRLLNPFPPSPAPSAQAQLTREFRSQINQAADYKTMYRLIGEELWIVDQLMADSDARKQAGGVTVAAEVGRVALSDAGSPWLAARIYEGYVWPQLERAGTNQVRFDVDAAMDLAEDAFREAGETNNLVLNYRLLIAKAPQSPRTDKMRVRAAALLDEMGELAEALGYLKEIKNPSSRVQKRIESLEARLRGKSKR
jgi:hypothetical protein